jgi:thiocyanate hydrolase subunit beta
VSPPRSFDELSGRVADLAPVLREPLDSPYEISNDLYAALRHVLHDVGGQVDLPLPFKEKAAEEWEMNTYVTCECLGRRGAWKSEERRRAENDLGATLYFGLPYYARWRPRPKCLPTRDSSRPTSRRASLRRMHPGRETMIR